MGEWLLSRRDRMIVAMHEVSGWRCIFSLRSYYSRLVQAEIRSIVPLGRGYFPHDSRHFVPGYYHAVPLGQNTFSGLAVSDLVH
jgi:hypothetical protein